MNGQYNCKWSSVTNTKKDYEKGKIKAVVAVQDSELTIGSKQGPEKYGRQFSEIPYFMCNCREKIKKIKQDINVHKEWDTA